MYSCGVVKSLNKGIQSFCALYYGAYGIDSRVYALKSHIVCDAVAWLCVLLGGLAGTSGWASHRSAL